LAWIIEYADTALKQLKKMDRQIARSIFEYLDERVSQLENPRELGKNWWGHNMELIGAIEWVMFVSCVTLKTKS